MEKLIKISSDRIFNYLDNNQSKNILLKYKYKAASLGFVTKI